MDSSLAALPIHDPNTRHTQTHLHNLSQTYAHVHSKLEQTHPTKRRRGNSVNPPPPAIPAEHTTPTPSTNWPSYHAYASPLTERTFDSSVKRSISPDQASRVSTTSSQPQLRKKPKSSSIKNNHLLRIASTGVAQFSSSPVFDSTVQREFAPLQNPGHIQVNIGPPVTRTNSGTSQHQSPTQKRAPASHSSYGVETICGPPPSYSTQRTLSQERIRKVDRSSPSRVQTFPPDQTQTIDDMQNPSRQKKERTSILIQSSPDTTDSHSIPTPTDVDNMSGVRIRGEQRTSMDEEGKASSSDERKSEDLFLNIARIDTARPLPAKAEKRRSRISIPFLPNNRQTHTTRSSPTQPQFESTAASTPRSDTRLYHTKHASLGGQGSGNFLSTRAHLADSNRFREQSIDASSDNERNDNTGYGALRRASTTNTEATRLAHRSSAGLRNSRLVSESVQVDRPKTGEQIATESTISTTAPSTVWDELDDLKSRIRKLELTGKLPPSSAAAMASTERPRTATTAATTMSTSPKYKASESNLQSNTESVPGTFNPLLHEALDNAKLVLSQDIYQKLQATAHDALKLAAMASTENLNSRNNSIAASNERQMRRCTESMCRSLTELAIALAVEAKPSASANQPVGREQTLPPNSMLRSRRYSNEPADRNHVPFRVQSRLDSRRTSLHLRSTNGSVSPERMQSQTPGNTSLPSEGRVNRSSALFQKRGQGSFDGTSDQLDASPSIRPGSRAMTDLGTYRRMSRDVQQQRGSSGQHLLPSSDVQEYDSTMTSNVTTHSSNTNSNFTSRRKYASPASVVMVEAHGNGPMTPREEWGQISSGNVEAPFPDVVSDVGGQARSGSTRLNLGFAGRIGSSVGSRLRAVKTEKNSREGMDMGTRWKDGAIGT